MRLIAALFAVLALLIVSFAAFAYWLHSSLNSPVVHTRSTDYITVEKGSTPSQIIARLGQEGIITSPSAVMLYLRTMGDASKLQAGEYQFTSPITALEVLKVLEKGEDRMSRITIPEGFTRFDIAKRILQRFPQKEPMTEAAVVAMMNDTSLIRDIAPTAANLEGYMYPSTYDLPRDAKPQDVIRVTVEQFRKVWRPEYSERARQLGRTPHEIVTIASLVETETAVVNERPVVAGVINNRLARGMPLGIDQTNVYIAKMLGRWDGTIHKSDLEVDSPYNTRIKAGLPPGPISSVSENSINSALNPVPSNYLFYVLNVDANDGSHWFYASAAEFERGKARYQQWLERERQIKRAQEAAPTPQ
jgi:UPF0755 protein